MVSPFTVDRLIRREVPVSFWVHLYERDIVRLAEC
ncbi:hypothetical protein Brsp06_03345 [Brucella sp. NBRC 13694]|jgi:hypothetical protein|nr:hypothetical protein DR92_643 [Brucella anthropi]NIH77069.1 hypothetical protein [Ochrobactrum sp. P20RRXII]SUA67040.1 Uncharacterised protein [Brucella anthropi]